jgi:hypothetical protein
MVGSLWHFSFPSPNSSSVAFLFPDVGLWYQKEQSGPFLSLFFFFKRNCICFDRLEGSEELHGGFFLFYLIQDFLKINNWLCRDHFKKSLKGK